MSESSKLKKEKEYQNVCTRLRLKYPKVLVTEKCRPLKIGIDRDIAADNPEIDVRMIRRFLRFYCGKEEYLHAIINAKKRVGLDGKSVEAIAPEARQFAIEQLAYRASLISNKEGGKNVTNRGHGGADANGGSTSNSDSRSSAGIGDDGKERRVIRLARPIGAREGIIQGGESAVRPNSGGTNNKTFEVVRRKYPVGALKAGASGNKAKPG